MKKRKSLTIKWLVLDHNVFLKVLFKHFASFVLQVWCFYHHFLSSVKRTKVHLQVNPGPVACRLFAAKKLFAHRRCHIIIVTAKKDGSGDTVERNSNFNINELYSCRAVTSISVFTYVRSYEERDRSIRNVCMKTVKITTLCTISCSQYS